MMAHIRCQINTCANNSNSGWRQVVNLTTRGLTGAKYLSPGHTAMPSGVASQHRGWCPAHSFKH